MATREPAPRGYTAYLFGSFQVYKDRAPLGSGAPGLSAASTLLKWFLLHPEVTMRTRDLLLVLDGYPDDSSRARLNRTLHYLRKYLEPCPAGGSSTFIKNCSTGYTFEPAGQWTVDLWDVEAMLARARRAREVGDVEDEVLALESLAHLEELAFLPGDLYNDTFSEARLDAAQKCHDSRDRLLELYISTERAAQALQLGLATMEQEPYSEYAAWAVASAHAHAGDPVSAIRTLVDFRNRLQQDLGSSPGPLIVELEAGLRCGGSGSPGRRTRSFGNNAGPHGCWPGDMLPF